MSPGMAAGTCTHQVSCRSLHPAICPASVILGATLTMLIMTLRTIGGMAKTALAINPTTGP
jgi:hypothetical protein